ncbi:hypothetical protein SSX86_027365 [Deinandra increscens subsp. villosa]|uniref:Protein transport protein Sec61 subunit beta n=1 Tax=Deinandra increscens subsp. villosa TaxID=3103831 RepID=A0AAP0CGN9_9ASTR
MALNGAAPPRGSAAATAANLRRRKTSGTGGAAAGGTAGNMLQFYTDDAPGLKISPNVVLVMSIGFIAFVAVLHVMDNDQSIVTQFVGTPTIYDLVRAYPIVVLLRTGNARDRDFIPDFDDFRSDVKRT